jgi:hypothetical protein
MRMGMRRFTRLTKGFSKKIENPLKTLTEAANGYRTSEAARPASLMIHLCA